ncbi:M67 family metallopeptidase [Pacificimonas sp. WHA3]|uniref:M67 family metallopeptidase n=1 Tax=Pacificimonas pallii TaxID=2827236 RepID=A0ABS6S9Z1_9SPHN|nr:M67 family metallopeptidase [Pacificimonas pallii]MBV7255177.1 M67 family metallopeptidase [Pacificimonas pallii]
MEWQIAREALQVARDHAVSAYPDEACGLLLGRVGDAEGVQVIVETRPAQNISPTPRRAFEIDPAALFQAQRGARQGGPRLLGYYHSHPDGDLQPSPRDADGAAPDGMLWLILAGEKHAAYLAGPAGLHNRFLTISLHETEG